MVKELAVLRAKRDLIMSRNGELSLITKLSNKITHIENCIRKETNREKERNKSIVAKARKEANKRINDANQEKALFNRLAKLKEDKTDLSYAHYNVMAYVEANNKRPTITTRRKSKVYGKPDE